MKLKRAYISVNKQTVAKNSRTGSRDPAIAVRTSKSGKAEMVNRVAINGPCEVIYTPDKPILKCGARLVIEADAEDVFIQTRQGKELIWEPVTT